MMKYGLVGKDIDYSFSKKYFEEKFKKELIDATYENFDLSTLSEFKKVIQKNKKLAGLNVTTPYKEEIIPFLNEVEAQAKNIGAVNTIQFKDGKLIGHNTDGFGFVKSIFTLIENHHEKALILGTGGASKAVINGLNSMSIESTVVSRNPEGQQISYRDLTKDVIEEHLLIVNCTPVGTHPNESKCPDIPYKYLTHKHFLYDLVYNPSMTKFLALGNQKGAKITNGSKMLAFQAERAWQIWNE